MPAHRNPIRLKALTIVTMLTSAFLFACSDDRAETGIAESSEETPAQETVQASDNGAVDNILLAEWTGPYEGVPAFDQMNLDDLKPAMEKAMAEELAEVDAIAGNPEPPTFANTIEAMERRCQRPGATGCGHDTHRSHCALLPAAPGARFVPCSAPCHSCRWSGR